MVLWSVLYIFIQSCDHTRISPNRSIIISQHTCDSYIICISWIFLLLLQTLHLLTCTCPYNWCLPAWHPYIYIYTTGQYCVYSFYLHQSTHVNNTHEYNCFFQYFNFRSIFWHVFFFYFISITSINLWVNCFLIVMLSGWTIILFRKARLTFYNIWFFYIA